MNSKTRTPLERLLWLSVIRTKFFRIAKRTDDDELRRLALDAAFIITELADEPMDGQPRSANS